MRRLASWLGRFLLELARAQHRDQVMLRAAALAYTTLVSLVPLLTVALVTVGRVEPERAELVVQALAAVLPFSPSQVQTTLTAMAERSMALGWISVALSALISVYTFFQIEEVINSIWAVPDRRRWQWRLASFIALLVWGPLLLVLLFSFLFWISAQHWFPAAATVARPLPTLFAAGALAAIYRWVPHTKVRWRWALVGAGVGACSLTLIHVGFQSYLELAGRLDVVYGSLSLVILFLLSLYMFWLAILLGAEAAWVTAFVATRGPATARPEVLQLLVEVSREGLVTHQRAAELLGEDATATLAALARDPGLLAPTAEGWRPGKAATTTPLVEAMKGLTTLSFTPGKTSGDEEPKEPAQGKS